MQDHELIMSSKDDPKPFAWASTQLQGLRGKKEILCKKITLEHLVSKMKIN